MELMNLYYNPNILKNSVSDENFNEAKALENGLKNLTAEKIKSEGIFVNRVVDTTKVMQRFKCEFKKIPPTSINDVDFIEVDY